MGSQVASAVGVSAALFICISLVSFLPFTASANQRSLVVSHSPVLELSPRVVVENSPGAKPGSKVLCERIEINGLSRLKNLKKFANSVKVRAAYVNSSSRLPNAEVCFHRNASLGIGMCPQGQWEKLTKGRWVRSMSPYDHKLLDIRMVGSYLETLQVSLDEEFFMYRIIFLVLGVSMMTLAYLLSQSILFYYSGAMAVGILLVILMVLFQGMKLLPTGRKNSLAIFVYSSIVGLGSFLLHYVPKLLRSVLIEIGIDEDVYNLVLFLAYTLVNQLISLAKRALRSESELVPSSNGGFVFFSSAIFLVVCLVISGAWLGFWVVRKLVLREDGSIDTGVAHFVACSIRIFASVMILQSSVDPLLAAGALACGILLSSLLRRLCKAKFIHDFYKRSHNESRTSRRSPFSTSVQGATSNSAAHWSDMDTFYSTFHRTPDRKNFSKQEWDKFTRDSTKRALEGLVSSPDFSQWAVAHAERITLAPRREDTLKRGTWFRWF